MQPTAAAGDGGVGERGWLAPAQPCFRASGPAGAQVLGPQRVNTVSLTLEEILSFPQAGFAGVGYPFSGGAPFRKWPPGGRDPVMQPWSGLGVFPSSLESPALIQSFPVIYGESPQERV